MSHHPHDFIDISKHAIDALSIGVAVATLIQWLPSIAALLTIVWTSIRIYETDTVQAMLGKAKS